MSGFFVTDMLLSLGAAHGRTGQAMKPEGVVIHYVGNPGSSAAANRNYFENGSGGNGVSAHYIIGLDGEIIRCVPDDERAMHAGKSYGPAWDSMAKTNNARYIGVETCHPDAAGKFNDKTTAALVWLVRELCQKWGLDPAKDVIRHYDCAGKQCPMYYVKNPAEWEKLKAAFAPAPATFEQNCDKLERAGIMNPAAYWKQRRGIDPYFEGLVLNMAERV